MKLNVKKSAAAGLAFLWIGGVIAGTAIPLGGSAVSDSGLASAHLQQYAASGIPGEESQAAIPLSASPAAEVAPTIGSNGKVLDLSQLPDSKTRYPFDAVAPLTDGFGYRSEPVAGFHGAQDLAPGEGTPIRIVASGVVTEAGLAADGWCGFGLTVQHRVNNQNVTSRYCHMQSGSHEYKVGDLVDMGDQAGRVGNTGLSFGAHLHLIISVNDTPVDPLPFLTKNA